MPNVVLCAKCKKERTTYNDPRKGPTIIECKVCFESHKSWTFVREEQEESSDVAVLSPSNSDAGSPERGRERDANGSENGSPKPAPPVAKRAFEDNSEAKEEAKGESKPKEEKKKEEESCCSTM